MWEEKGGVGSQSLVPSLVPGTLGVWVWKHEAMGRRQSS